MIEHEEVLYEDADGAQHGVPADHVALAIGWRPVGSKLAGELRDVEVVVLGDASRPSDFVARHQRRRRRGTGAMSGPLEGIKVLDLTRLLPGAFATALLADLGADVLKVEQPGIGDPMRAYDAARRRLARRSAGSPTATSARSRSTCATRAGSRRSTGSRRDADVLIEGFRPGVADRLGVGYDALKAVNPRLVYCSLSGFGATGPLEREAGARHQLPRPRGRARRGAAARPDRRPLRLADGRLRPAGRARARAADRRGRPRRHLDHRRARSRCTRSTSARSSPTARRRTCCYGGYPCYRDLRVRGRQAAHGRRARAAVLAGAVRGARPPRPASRRSTTRPRSSSGRSSSPAARATPGWRCSPGATRASGRSTTSPRRRPTRSWRTARWSSSSSTRSSGRSSRSACRSSCASDPDRSARPRRCSGEATRERLTAVGYAEDEIEQLLADGVAAEPERMVAPQ